MVVTAMWQHALTSGWSSDEAGLGTRLRVLVESADPVAEISDFRSFRQAGIDVAVCSGPRAYADECPLVAGGCCEFAERADVVLVELPPSRRETKDVVDAMRAHHPGTPIVMQVPRQGAAVSACVPEGVIPLLMPASVDQQIRVVRRAAVDGRRRQPHD